MHRYLFPLFASLCCLHSSFAQEARNRAEPGPFTGFDYYLSFDFRHDGVLKTHRGNDSDYPHLSTFWDLDSSSQITGNETRHSFRKALDLSQDRKSALHLGRFGKLFLTQLDSESPPRPIDLPGHLSAATFTSDGEGIFYAASQYPLTLGAIEIESGARRWQKAYEGRFKQFHYPNDSRLILLRWMDESYLYDFDRIIVIDTDTGDALLDRELTVYSEFYFTFFEGARKHLLLNGVTIGETYHKTAIVNSDTGEIIPVGEDQSVLLGRFLANGQLVMLKNDLNDNSYRIFNTDDGSLFLDLAEFGFPETDRATVDLERKRLFVRVDSGIEVWDTESKTLLFSLPTDSRSAAWIAVSDDGQRLAALLSDGSIRVWDVDSPSSPRDFPQGIAPISVRFRFSPNSHHLVFGNQRDLVFFDTDLESQAIRPIARSSIELAGFDRSAGLFYVIDQKREVSYFSSETLEPTSHEPYALPDGNLLAARAESRTLLSSYGKSIRISDLDTGETKWELEAESNVSSGWLSPDGSYLAFLDEESGEHHFFDATAHTATVSIPFEVDRNTLYRKTAISPDFRSLIIQTQDPDRTPERLLHIFTIDHQNRTYTSKELVLSGPTYGFCVSDDSKWLYFVEKIDGSYLLTRLSLKTDAPLERLQNPFSSTPRFVFNVSLPDRLLLISSENEACFVDRETGHPTDRFELILDQYGVDLHECELFFDPHHSTLALSSSRFPVYDAFTTWRLRSDLPLPLSVEVGTDSVELDIAVAEGASFFIESSPDLINWRANPPATSSETGSTRRSVPISPHHTEVFFRAFETSEFTAAE
ncbi:hypothetical protein [Pelagicoccus sp. SDUM812003]|uniref:hypothetical protein n=1 Tax=Pelagicoccus sp. SDUM812003 TaxID=3041267 RepID=UPI00281014A4|nr:hypothetical protein [Pelagicoccus sp. SDUM812003]MDQ8202926.1 hypothetical protein [Pelagicoccus sp. SDUM812003]